MKMRQKTSERLRGDQKGEIMGDRKIIREMKRRKKQINNPAMISDRRSIFKKKENMTTQEYSNWKKRVTDNKT